MAMSPITQTIEGKSLTFLLPFASLITILTPALLDESIPRYAQTNVFGSAQEPFRDAHGVIIDVGLWKAPADQTATTWANIILASPAAQKPNIPDDQIIAILAAALVGGGMAAALAADTADHIFHGQLDQSVSKLAATCVLAAIAAFP